MQRTLLVTNVLVVLVSACTGSTTQQTRFEYNCDNGESVAMRFFPQQGVASLVRGGQTSELTQQRTPRGFTYSGGPTTLRVTDDRLSMTMQIGMMVNTRCRAR
jgi:membrane-bound inhibitor of C-type lysozyme